MIMKDTECCAIQEITGLGAYETGLDAMVAFCRNNLDKRCVYHDSPGSKGVIYSYYLFTSAITHDGRPYGIGLYAYDRHVLYGDNFANFIREHKLGEVIEAPPRSNQAFHSGSHSNKVWLWLPDQEAVRAWWAAHNTPKPVDPPIATQPQTLEATV